MRDAFTRQRHDVAIDDNGYVRSFHENLLPLVETEDFEFDLSAGDGNELETKFRAVHSSSALAVNCFAPFRTRITDLGMPPGRAVEHLEFERKCPTGLRGGGAPNLDVLLSGPAGIVGIESKLTEYLVRHRLEFSPAYAEQIRNERREQGYFREMLRLVDEPDSYSWLDAAQLIKHAFGLAQTFPDKSVTLLYLYWEPFDEHRQDLTAFAARVAESTEAMSYAEFWSGWRETAPTWLTQHLDNLAERYLIIL